MTRIKLFVAPVVLGALGAAPLLLAASPADCERRPASLRGTEVDGSLTVDARGRFVPTLGARLLFDYFLTATGEEPVQAIRARVVTEIGARLSGEVAAAAGAVRLFDLYLMYLDRARDLAPLKGRLDEESALEVLSDLRREVLGREVLGREVAGVFFGADEEADRAALRARLLGEPSSNAAPDTLGLREEEALRAGGASAAEVRAFRERAFGAAAAERLEALDRQEADFRHRLGVYRERKAGASPERREELLAAFTPEERLRVAALDRIEGK